MFNYGFTGTSHGMTSEQLEAFRELVLGVAFRNMIFQHGGCVGADEAAHDVVVELPGVRTVVRPGVTKTGMRYKRGMFNNAHFVHEEKPFLDRNRDIVDTSDILIVCPRTMSEELRSGTWATVRYAQKVGKPIIIVWPDGSVQQITHI